MTRFLVTSIALILAAGTAVAEPRSYALPEPTAQLRAPQGGTDTTHIIGFEAAQANCMSCHSVDYIAMQPPGKGKAFWEAVVSKMIKVYHAPIAEADAKVIAAYLTATY